MLVLSVQMQTQPLMVGSEWALLVLGKCDYEDALNLSQDTIAPS
jgi:hypothetical protein